jgi:hypothetical protein
MENFMVAFIRNIMIFKQNFNLFGEKFLHSFSFICIYKNNLKTTNTQQKHKFFNKKIIFDLRY